FTSSSSMLVSKLPSVHRGTLFEKQALHVLQTYFSMSLHRVGGKDDGGVDLRGWWWLPPLNTDELDTRPRSRIRVIAQCKAEKKKMGPGYVREMEGVLHRHMYAPGDVPASPKAIARKRNSTVALIVSASPFTKSAVLRAFSSTLPFLLLHLPFFEPREPDVASFDSVESQQQLGSVFWNTALSHGVLGDELELRWERFTNDIPQDIESSPHTLGRPGFWWNKTPVQNWVPSHYAGSEP
ncbi:hypothetical protein SCHPADRAFT_834236, partial [Schizopora paradoxa]